MSMTSNVSTSMTKEEKILVLCPIGLGNYVMCTPAIEHLGSRFGKKNLGLLALRKGVSDMGLASNWFENVHYWDPDVQSKLTGLKTLLEIRKASYTSTISLFPAKHLGFYLFSFFSGAKNRYGLDYPNASRLKSLLTKSAELKQDLHDVDQNLTLVNFFYPGASESSREVSYPIPPIQPEGLLTNREPYYVCHPGSSAERGMVDKRLPPEQFAAMISKIYEQFALKCVLIGGPEEHGLREHIQSLCGDAILPLGSKSLAELGGLIKPSLFFLGNFSGLMHISVAFGKRCIAFPGPWHELRGGPYSKHLLVGRKSEHLLLYREDLQCYPCWSNATVGANPPCIFGDRRCLTHFDVLTCWSKVAPYIEDILKEDNLNANC